MSLIESSAAASAIERVRKDIDEGNDVDPTHRTGMYVVLLSTSGIIFEGWVGIPFQGDTGSEVRRFAHLKADISLRTKRSVHDVLNNAPGLLRRNERALHTGGRNRKLHAGGVYYRNIIAVGVAGAGRGLDCHVAKLVASTYVAELDAPSIEAA